RWIWSDCFELLVDYGKRLFFAKSSVHRGASNQPKSFPEPLEVGTQRGKVRSSTPAWRNWQTRWTQNPVIARSCGFDPLRRQSVSPVSFTRENESRSRTGRTSHWHEAKHLSRPCIHRLSLV